MQKQAHDFIKQTETKTATELVARHDAQRPSVVTVERKNAMSGWIQVHVNVALFFRVWSARA